MANNPLRRIPSVHELLESPPLRGLVDRVSHHVVVEEVRSFLDQLRSDLQHKAADVRIPTASELADRIARWIDTDHRPRLRGVINATGLIVHPGLGRSPLSEDAVKDVIAIATGYSNLEVDLETAARSQRVRAVDKLLMELTGAEAALVVNNNAGATWLALTALAKGREVIVSRGHLVEIGESYRLPDIVALSGAVLREVGTTNQTRVRDYAQAIDESAAALLRVQPSNYVIRGVTEQASLDELVTLGRRHGLPVIDDIGSGALIDLTEFGLTDEPLVKDSVTAGADLVLFSGDKLLGGPQCGVIVGRRERVEALVRHPLARALQVNKMTLAALAATLQLYRDPVQAKSRIPLLMLLGTSVENLANRAQRLAPQLQQCRAVRVAEVVAGTTFLGDGSVPTQELPTWCVSLEPSEGSVEQLARRLRMGSFALFGRIQQERLVLDLRAVFPAQDVQVLQAVHALDENVANA